MSEDGQTFTAEFSIEFTGEGAPTGEYGPGHVTGTRINVEPMGTPAGSLDDLFAQFEEGTTPAVPTSQAGTSADPGTEPAGTTPQAPNRWGPRRAILRWLPRRASRSAGAEVDQLLVAIARILDELGPSFRETRAALTSWSRIVVADDPTLKAPVCGNRLGATA